MLYSIITTALGEQFGIMPGLHRLTAGGKKMVVNENELRNVDPDIRAAAELLGGLVMSRGEVISELKTTDRL